MNYEEYIRFQELKSIATMSGKLTTEEGMTVYKALGESLSAFNNQPVHIKSVLMGLFEKLLKTAMGLSPV